MEERHIIPEYSEDSEFCNEYDDYDYDTPEYIRFEENMNRIPWVSDTEKGWCRETVLKLAEDDPMMSLEVCQAYLCSDKFEPDTAKAARWAIKAAKNGSRCVGVILNYLLQRPSGRLSPCRTSPSKVIEGEEFYLPSYYYTSTVFQVLMMVTNSYWNMETGYSGWSNESDGFENDVFLFRVSRYIDLDYEKDRFEESELPKFVFKPTGLRMWYDEDPSDTFLSNQPVDFAILNEIFNKCIEGARDCFRKGVMERPPTPRDHKVAYQWDKVMFPQCDTVQWLNDHPWPGHGAEVYAMEDEIRDALELTGFRAGCRCVNY